MNLLDWNVNKREIKKEKVQMKPPYNDKIKQKELLILDFLSDRDHWHQRE